MVTFLEVALVGWMVIVGIFAVVLLILILISLVEDDMGPIQSGSGLMFIAIFLGWAWPIVITVLVVGYGAYNAARMIRHREIFLS